VVVGKYRLLISLLCGTLRFRMVYVARHGVSCCNNSLCNPKQISARQEFLHRADWTQLASDSVQRSVPGGAEWLCACAVAALFAAGPELSQQWIQEQAHRLLGTPQHDHTVCPPSCSLHGTVMVIQERMGCI
jgi:hypothetical protein